jgi:hypothetical protein
MDHFSFIDHFVAFASVYESPIESCTVKHDGCNLSDNDPITLSIDIDWSSFDRAARGNTLTNVAGIELAHRT